MEGIHQHTPVGAVSIGHHPHGLAQVTHISPRHELQMRMNAIPRRQIAQRSKALGQARFIRVVASHQQFGAAQLGTHRQNRLEIGHASFRFQPQDLQVEYLDAGVAQACLGLPAQVGIGHQREMLLLLGGRHQAQANVAVTGAGGCLDHVRRGKLKHRQRRQRENSISHYRHQIS
ncbi:hypothetical protein D9M71_660320 [compost metagenome]